jgi:hypothetical protein
VRYFLDTEFNGFGGALLSLALVSETGENLYLVYDPPEILDPFVQEKVNPRLFSLPPGVVARRVNQAAGAEAIEVFLRGDPAPEIIADWPDDVRLCCQALMIAPGRTAPIPRLRFDIRRVAPYPTDLPDAVEHNAYWDAMALQRRLGRSSPPEMAAARRRADFGVAAPQDEFRAVPNEDAQQFE